MKDTTLYETLPVRKLFWRAVLPSIASSVVWGISNIWEGITVGQSMGQDALAAMSLTMPFFMISMALADLIASGASLQISIHLGRKDEHRAREIFTSACILIVLISFALGVFLFLCADDMLHLMGAEEAVVRLATKYLKVFALLAPLSMLFFGADDFLRICGKVKYSMAANLCICFINIFMVWLLVGRLKLGLSASSAITSGSFAFGSILCFIPLLRGNLALKFVRPRLGKAMFRRILMGGLPTFFANAATSGVAIFLNTTVIRLGGTLAVSALSIKNYIDAIPRILLNGMSVSLRPSLGYNYGAKRIDRVGSIEKRLLSVGALVAAGIFALLFFGAEAIVPVFCQAGDLALVELGVKVVRICAFSHLFLWFAIMSNMIFSALERPAYSLTMSILRTFVFPVGGIILLSLLFGLTGVWYSFAAAELFAALLSLVFFIKVSLALRRQTALQMEVLAP